MSKNHIYLMSLAASGKSTFANANPEYKGYRIVDFANHLPKRNPLITVLMYLLRPFPSIQLRLRRNPSFNKIGPHYYFDSVRDFLSRQEIPTVIMGRRLPPRFLEEDVFGDCLLGIVMIPEAQHKKQCEARRQQLRNPVPFFDHWTTNFDKVMLLRDQMTGYAAKYGIEVFESFGEAVDTLLTPGEG